MLDVLDDLFDTGAGEPGQTAQEDINGLTDEDLKRYVEKVDLADGKPDGKMDRKGSAMDCPKCKRRILKSAIVCPWCGTRAESGNPFEAM